MKVKKISQCNLKRKEGRKRKCEEANVNTRKENRSNSS